MEIGSFIELQFEKGLEYYKGADVARLNCGRAAIYHSVRLTGCDTVWLPYYQCDSVRDFLLGKGVNIKYYHIDKEFLPVDLEQKNNEAVLFANYYGIFGDKRMKNLADRFNNVIIDNCQAFFAKPIENAYNVYSARKFVGAPDGAYVVGKNADRFINEYKQDYSSDTALFLLQRIEYGCEGKAYETRKINEERLEENTVKKMSKLTRTILDGTDYEKIKQIRKDNYRTACEMFKDINEISPDAFSEADTVPMVYPLVVSDDGLLPYLQKNKMFQGHWWSYILDEMPADTYEYYLSRFVIPITIDQRYGIDELTFTEEKVKEYLKK